VFYEVNEVDGEVNVIIGQRLPPLTFRASCDMIPKVFLLLATKSFIPHR
jgi:hypothetical protein